MVKKPERPVRCVQRDRLYIYSDTIDGDIDNISNRLKEHYDSWAAEKDVPAWEDLISKTLDIEQYYEDTTFYISFTYHETDKSLKQREKKYQEDLKKYEQYVKNGGLEKEIEKQQQELKSKVERLEQEKSKLENNLKKLNEELSKVTR